MLTVESAEVLMLDHDTMVVRAMDDSSKHKNLSDWPECAHTRVSISCDELFFDTVAYGVRVKAGQFAILSIDPTPYGHQLFVVEHRPINSAWYPWQCRITPEAEALDLLKTEGDRVLTAIQREVRRRDAKVYHQVGETGN